MPQDADLSHSRATPDWEALERSPEFRELRAARRRLLNPLLAITAAGLAIYTVLLVTAGDGFLGDRVVGLTWGLLLIAAMTVFIFVLSATYSRISLGTFDPLVEKMKASAFRDEDAASRHRGGSLGDLDGSAQEQTGSRVAREGTS